ncbi:MAG TPA: flavin reductase family protein [Streptosporangiaceae bacterium]|jgi:3-hydroxy-9,10-secoandrosta-1,3,5(10)-triene-9,17-dione monooxygenase reductase component
MSSASAARTEAAVTGAASATAGGAQARHSASATLDAVTSDPQRFRQVLGHFATGVTVITGIHDGEPVGFACQAFAGLSLAPPLVLFCPSRSSSTWPRIASSGAFCANILSDGQRDLARKFGVSAADKFAGVDWAPGSNGAPVLGGVLTWACCSVGSVHDGGDHDVVIARVTDLGDVVAGDPLLFYRGRFTLSVTSDGDTPPEVVDTLLAWPRFADWM